MRKINLLFRKLSIIPLLMATACSVELPEEVAEVYAEVPDQLDFNIHVKPILSDKCFACHGPDKGKIVAGLQLHSAETAYAESKQTPGAHAIVPGDLKNSQVFHRITSDDPDFMMPTPEFNVPLTAEEKAILIKWIEQGAKYEPHWAFIKPKERPLPAVKQKDWVKNPIDAFILERLEKEGLTPSKEADKALLLRRLSFDLTGLPPTPEEINAFVNDTADNAYEKQVERLLASPHYGEKMAVDWMDLARYADTHGYQIDRFRDMSPWRDWVIKSFNDNMPYDEFVKWQLAGDLMPNATRAQILATGFNRLHAQNMEGGIVDEEFRVEYVADRTSLVGIGFMGLTYGCARCHDHKYDPISQKNFYELYSFFNNVNETGQISWDPGDMPVPNLLLPTKEQEKLISFIKNEIGEKTDDLEKVIASEQTTINSWIAQKQYQQIDGKSLNHQKRAHFKLNGSLKNSIGKEVGKMERKFSYNEKPTYAEGKAAKGLKLDGDAWLHLKPVGVYKRSDNFSIGMWVNIPEKLEEGVIFHKNQAVRLHSLKGYHVYLKDNKLEMIMAHTWPDNAIVERSTIAIPKDQWVHLTMTYDGSSKASGLKLFLNGVPVPTEVEVDNLYKEIIFHDYEDIIYSQPIEPGLKIGGRWRGIGIKDARVDDIEVFDRSLSALEVMLLGNPAQAQNIIAKAPTELSKAEKDLLEEFYLKTISKPYQKAYQAWMKKQEKLAEEMEPIQEAMVMKEMDQPRQAYILERGQYDVLGDSVFPNTPESILPFPEDLPRNRLGLAEWLMHPDHPLTARVAVNRYWQHYFGSGIVRTTEDFGNQGEQPSHAELLDWLALEFINSNWDVKALQKKIVMSATYRQSTVTSDELRAIDPANILLARGPKMRLTSEMMRDNTLLASGLLKNRIGGKSVNPYQPYGLYKMNSAVYTPSTGDDLYRRSLYTVWKRTIPHPTQATFDQPERSECTVRRQKTNTPLQALVLLNDPTFVEGAKKMGEEISQAENLKSGIEEAFIKLTGRTPQQKELDILIALQQHELAAFKADKKRAKGWLSAGAYTINPALDPNLVAANAVVASAIINADASITKR